MKLTQETYVRTQYLKRVNVLKKKFTCYDATVSEASKKTSSSMNLNSGSISFRILKCRIFFGFHVGYVLFEQLHQKCNN